MHFILLSVLSVLDLMTSGHNMVSDHQSLHAFYVSVLEITYPVEDERTSLRVKVFSNDLQSAVSEFHHLDALITVDAMCGESESRIVSYLTEHILIKFDDQTTRLQLRDCRQEGDSHWLTFEIADRPWKQASISADFFMELFPTQTQIVNVNHSGTKQFGRLTVRQKSIVWRF